MPFTTTSRNVSKSDASNTILFQARVFGKNIKGTPLAKYFTKVTACSSFMSPLNIKMENMLQRFSCISFLFKPPCFGIRKECSRQAKDNIPCFLIPIRKYRLSEFVFDKLFLRL